MSVIAIPAGTRLVMRLNTGLNKSWIRYTVPGLLETSSPARLTRMCMLSASSSLRCRCTPSILSAG